MHCSLRSRSVAVWWRCCARGVNGGFFGVWRKNVGEIVGCKKYFRIFVNGEAVIIACD